MVLKVPPTKGSKGGGAVRRETSKYAPSLRTLLHKKNWDEAAKKIASDPQEAEIEDRMGDLPLHICCDSGAPFQIVQKLIHVHQPALRKKGFCGRLPLHYAAYNKPSVNIIKLLLRHYPEAAKELDEDGRLPLHLAVVRNAPKQSIQALVEAYPKALVTPNKFGNTPVELARNELVADLLTEELNRPRGIKAKMAVERKINAVWTDLRQNPIAESIKKKLTPAGGASATPRKNNSTRANTSPRKNNSTRRGPLRDVSPALYANSAPVKRVPGPSYKYSSARGLTAGSEDSPRSSIGIMEAGIRMPIPEPESGAGGYGGRVVMSDYRRTFVPSPSRVRVDASLE